MVGLQMIQDPHDQFDHVDLIATITYLTFNAVQKVVLYTNIPCWLPKVLLGVKCLQASAASYRAQEEKQLGLMKASKPKKSIN